MNHRADSVELRSSVGELRQKRTEEVPGHWEWRFVVAVARFVILFWRSGNYLERGSRIVKFALAAAGRALNRLKSGSRAIRLLPIQGRRGLSADGVRIWLQEENEEGEEIVRLTGLLTCAGQLGNCWDRRARRNGVGRLRPALEGVERSAR